MQINHLDLFSGIGGFALGLKMADERAFNTLAFCEIEPYCQKILKQNFNKKHIFNNVEKINENDFKDKIDLITAGFPCQDLSIAGNRIGLQGQRSGLFYEVIRIIKFTKPKFILFENSSELIRRDSNRQVFIKELQSIGYDLWWQLLCAKSFGYPHKRERAYVLCWKTSANSNSIGQFFNEKFQYFYANENTQKPSKKIISLCSMYREMPKKNYEINSIDIRGYDGISETMDRVKALGNSIIPTIVKIYGLAIYSFIKIQKVSNNEF
ncbi:cytosine-specific DNA methyltransferase [Campylobacter volucris]|uniref:Cytosine-specific methyltransferase n=1 Tax=Campylobacter volucris TaxID=1031542 RepID=A0AAE5YHZ0_9BACT|nr:DNA (cytosine-5-)-methyltransferase [Campylobacter volucris]AJC94131.1 cytosine-specific DNA methyltransferase [Campylobacter volucris LMG 24379]KAB0580288.1 cytosine-specific DNA methyltransferase [Campylobacter volucris]QBL13498.1 cytosine-specific DNA methyltransferase [Campylobacter volucris]QEL08346.1 type II cytosine-specific DNA methyltransferase [Campylobacter volucris]TXK70535.1 cytosine-specific DNA methyltransferase [Campylobacter volucris]